MRDEKIIIGDLTGVDIGTEYKILSTSFNSIKLNEQKIKKVIIVCFDNQYENIISTISSDYTIKPFNNDKDAFKYIFNELKKTYNSNYEIIVLSFKKEVWQLKKNLSKNELSYIHFYTWSDFYKNNRAKNQNIPTNIEKNEFVKNSYDNKNLYQKFLNILSLHNFGPFSNIRESLYSSLEYFILQNSKIDNQFTLNQVIIDSVEQTKKNIDSSRSNKYPWRKVRTFMRNLLSKHPIFIDSDSTCIKYTFSTMNNIPISLIENWRLYLEGEIILTIINEIKTLSFEQLSDISAVLFGEQSISNENKVLKLIRFLLENRQLIEKSNSLYVYKELKTSKLKTAYELLLNAIQKVNQLGKNPSASIVKEEILNSNPIFNESSLGFFKFSEFLFQAESDKIISLYRKGSEFYLTIKGEKLDAKFFQRPVNLHQKDNDINPALLSIIYWSIKIINYNNIKKIPIDTLASTIKEFDQAFSLKKYGYSNSKGFISIVNHLENNKLISKEYDSEKNKYFIFVEDKFEEIMDKEKKPNNFDKIFYTKLTMTANVGWHYFCFQLLPVTFNSNKISRIL